MAAKNLAQYFIRKDVKDILHKITGFDLKKIFKYDFNPKLRSSKIQLLTKKQLMEENEKALSLAKRILQMPPYLAPRQRGDKVLSNDEKLNPLNLKNSKYLFIDISMNILREKRSIVVREPTGVLRTATHDEREKMLQVYYPQQGKSTYLPQMFDPIQLEECLKLKNYLIVLKKACAKFEPNDPDFIRVTHRVYQYINEAKDYEQLYSTRYYGPMVFYLTWNKNLDKLVAYLLNNSNVKDCVEIIHLYSILHGTNFLKDENDIQIIREFLSNELKNAAGAQLALSKYIESIKINKKAIN